MTLLMRDMEKGRAEGRAEGDAGRVIQSVESLMKSLKFTVEEACAALNIAIDTYLQAKTMFSK